MDRRDLTIMADTAILDGAAKQVKVPTLVAAAPRARAHSRRRWNGSTRRSPAPSSVGSRGQTHNLAAEPAAAMAKEFFLGR
jgi:hypothetical protein